MGNLNPPKNTLFYPCSIAIFTEISRLQQIRIFFKIKRHTANPDTPLKKSKYLKFQPARWLMSGSIFHGSSQSFHAVLDGWVRPVDYKVHQVLRKLNGYENMSWKYVLKRYCHKICSRQRNQIELFIFLRICPIVSLPWLKI